MKKLNAANQGPNARSLILNTRQDSADDSFPTLQRENGKVA
jgi:hypothetical protein